MLPNTIWQHVLYSEVESSHPHSRGKIRTLDFKFQPLVGPVLLTVEISRLHSDTPHSVVLLWTGDWFVAETSTSQHTTFTRYRLYALGGIRTLNSNNPGDADPRFWPQNHWRRFYVSVLSIFCKKAGNGKIFQN